MNLSAQSQDFQSQKLIVDYISFKFRSFDDNQERKIWSCLFELGFNSYQMSAKLSKPIKIDLFTNWDGVDYRKVTCIVRDFIKFQNPTISRTDHRILKQTKEFFDEVQTGILQTSFTSTHFQSLVAIPRVEYETNQQKQIIANVWVVEKLFYYDYPFYFPNFFEKNLTKHEFDVRFALFQTFCSIHIEKVVLVKQFIDSYPSALNNSQKTKIKEYFIEGVKILQENRLIEPNYKVISNGQLYEPEELTLKNISEGFVICEKLSISN
jgi:hypothetical protein